MKDDATKRPLESELMLLLDNIVKVAEEAESFIQDDSKISGPKDVQEITDRLMKIRSLTLEAEHLIRPPLPKRRPMKS